MHVSIDDNPSRKKQTSLTISKDVLAAAKALHINASRAAETGIISAIKEVQAEEWLRKNRNALEAHNARIDTDGTLLTPEWAMD